MTRQTYVYRDGLGVISKGLARFHDGHVARSHIAGPAIIRDNLDDMLSHADGKIYDSKSNYYRTLKETGHQRPKLPKLFARCATGISPRR